MCTPRDPVAGDNTIRRYADLVEKVVMIGNYDYDTKVIASSIRNEKQVRKVTMIGVYISLIPFKVL